ncbi:hypothetical protein [Fluviicola sp.]|uniref:hypothetical protein n=1 Tax=Fluviicola sp. TaxID=1917219 RepID=UPI00261CBF66|nr:hypothetical protein [Fluviicola sp.]
MDQTHSNKPNREFKSLHKSYQNWDAGTPSSDLWDDLEADLAVSAVWDRLDETLELNGSPADKTLVESFENWAPNTSGDGWTKLEEQLSRERVWNRLNTTLNYPVTTRIPWMKMAAASVLFVFLSFYTDYYFVKPDREEIVPIAGINGSKTISASEKETEAVNNVVETPGVESEKAVLAENVLSVAKENRIQHRQNNQNKEFAGTPDEQQTELRKDLALKNDGLQSNPKNTETNGATQNSTIQNNTNSVNNTVSTEKSAVSLSDLAQLDELGTKEIAFETRDVSSKIGDFTFIPLKSPFKPRFSLQVGGQFSFINEKNRSAFSSSLPSMGIAADFQYHYYLGNIRLTQDLGFSQYAQSNGTYINGRYTNLNQRLNTIFLMSSVGYTYRGATVYAGVSVNRLLSGYEANRSTITNVYNSNKFQIGATAGIDYHLAPFKNKTALGIGMQYQFVSKLKSGNADFSDIQGVKLQIKYSF